MPLWAWFNCTNDKGVIKQRDLWGKGYLSEELL